MMLIKKIALLLFILISLPAISADHHIFFVHGLAGTADTFGEMPARLTAHLDGLKKDDRHFSYVFTYETESNDKDSYDFSKSLADFVKEKVPTVDRDDKISFVAHSQGGLVSSILIFNSYADQAGYLNNYSHNFGVFVTLGTPFWGSKLADIVSHPASWVQEVLVAGNKQKVLPRAGDKQLKEMSLFSYTIKRFRKTISQMNPELVKAISKKMKILNIGGVANIEKLSKKYKSEIGNYGDLANLLPFVFGGEHEYEADIAVSIPSSRFDSIYVVDVVKNYRPGRLTSLDKSHETKMVEFIPVYGIHASPKPEKFLDIAYLPKQMCQVPLRCEHPTYELVYNHFVGLSNDKNAHRVDKKRLSGFVISFDIEFPFDHRYIGDDITVELVELDGKSHFPGGSIKDVKIEFDKFFEQRSRSKVVGDKSTGFHFTGSFTYPDDKGSIVHRKVIEKTQELVHQQGAALLFKIKARGFKRRYVRAIVKPMKSTYVNINLEPY